MRRTYIFGCMILFAGEHIATPVLASDANTHFAVLVPANNDNNGRDSTLVVTSHADGANVSVVDTDEDGDDDDSVEAVLNRGQSIVVRIKDGDVNDDAGGKWDGDRFVIDSDLPVTVMLQTKSDWQHDWVPAEGRTMRGQEFFIHGVTDRWDIDVVAYEDNTNVEIYEVTTAARRDSGITSVQLPGSLLVRQTLNRGEDLFKHRHGSGNDISRGGHTYRVLTSKPSTVAYGSLNSRSRDGGGYVPSENGTSMGTHFYLPAIAEAWAPHEKELRVVAGADASQVTVRGWNQQDGWYDIEVSDVPSYGHLDYTGRDTWLLRQASFIEVTGSAPLNVFYANWLETGAVGTSDVFTYVSALDSVGASDVGSEFVAYLGPPGREDRVAGVGASFSHLFAAAFTPGTEVRVRDVDTDGALIDRTVVIENRDDVTDLRISVEEYNQLNRPWAGVRPYLRVESTAPISLAMNNWNDNWLAFASGLLGPQLEVTVIPPAEVRCGRLESFALTLANVGELRVDNVQLQLSPVGPLSIEEEPEGVAGIDPGEVLDRTVGVQVACDTASTGELVGLGVTAAAESGDEEAVFVAHKQTATSPTHVPDRAGIFDLTTKRDGCAVELTWLTEEDGDVEYVVSRRLANSDEEPVEIGRVSSLGIAASGFAYGFRDSTPEQLTAYRYYVSAERDGASETIAGPVRGRPGLPFSVTPESTGNIAVDFDGIGTILTDAADFPASAGYDVRTIASSYDAVNDQLYLAIGTDGVFGDADGDGDPNASSDESVRDVDSFVDDETFTFILDLDNDSVPDTLVGVPLGGGLDLLQVGLYNSEVADTSPTMGFSPLPDELRGVVTASLLNTPSEGAPDLELVVNNPSVLLGHLKEADPEPLGDFGLGAYVAALAVAAEPDRVPDSGLEELTEEGTRTAGCGEATDQIHMGTFAAFGNIFTGAPTFDFVPLGWRNTKNGERLHAPPAPEEGRIIASPTVFMNRANVEIEGTLHADGYQDEFHVRIKDYNVKQDGNLVHVSEIDHRFPAEDQSRYENLDVQVFRMFTLDCSARVRIAQHGTSGPMLDERQVLLANGDIQTLMAFNPALVLSHTGLGTFARGGNMNRFAFATPEDWTSIIEPETDPAFTQYAFLNELSYHNLVDAPPEEDVIYPLGEEGVEIPAGIWFSNHYLWTYANSGITRVETIMEPGPDCRGEF